MSNSTILVSWKCPSAVARPFSSTAAAKRSTTWFVCGVEVLRNFGGGRTLGLTATYGGLAVTWTDKQQLCRMYLVGFHRIVNEDFLPEGLEPGVDDCVRPEVMLVIRETDGGDGTGAKLQEALYREQR